MNESFIKKMDVSSRILVGTTFLVAGIHKLLFWQGPAMWMTSKGIPFVNILLGIATATELIGAVLLFIGYRTKQASLWLFVFLLATTLMMHTFWKMEGMMFQTALLDFIQNIAILGGLLAIASIGFLKEKMSASF